MEISLAFSAVVTSTALIERTPAAASELFDVRPNPGAAKDVGARPQAVIVGRVLEPSNVFRQELTARVPVLEGKRPPWHTTLRGGQRVTVMPRLTQYPPAALAATLTVEGLEVEERGFAERLIALQEERERDPLAAVLRRSLGMMRDLDHRHHPLHDTPRTLVATEVRPPVERHEVKRWAQKNLVGLVGALIRTAPEDLDPGVAEKIAEQCKSMNEKVVTSFTLVARAGVIHVAPRDGGTQPGFKTLIELCHWAVAIRQFLESFRARRMEAPALYDFYLDIVRGMIEHGDTAIGFSHNSAEVWRVLAVAHKLPTLLKNLLDDGQTRKRLQASQDAFAPLRDGYWLDADLEARLSDAAVPQGERDLLEARTCLRVRAHKAAIVLAGLAAEALLVRAVAAATGYAPWRRELPDLVARAQRLVLLPATSTALALVDERLGRYRELVEPTRNGPTVDEQAAERAVHAVEQLAQELAAR